MPEKHSNNDEAANAVLSQAISALSARIDENEVETLIKDILDSVQVIEAKSGKLRGVGAEYFDVHFQGRIGHMFKVVGKAVAFQYSDFLGDLAGLQGLQKPREQSGSVNVPEHLNWPVWRVIISGMATLEKLRSWVDTRSLRRK